MIFGAIVAGGTGSRMNSSYSPVSFDEPLPNVPKQFLPLSGKPMICHSVEKFLSCKRIDKLIIGVHADFSDYLDEIIDRHFSERKDDIITVCGGADRNGTLMNMIKKLEDIFGESEEHMIITHDAVRPFVTTTMIEENIDLALKYGAVDTVYSTTDTVVVSENGEYIENVPDRSTLYNGQTPQSFNMSLLKKLYNDLDPEQQKTLTDACKIFNLSGRRVYFAKGDSTNMKITTKSDYFLAQTLADQLK